MSKAVKETEFYNRLGIAPEANLDEIKKAYKKMAIKFHPDKNPDDPTAVDKFKEVSEAYEVLSNEEKRAMYDKYGKEALKDGGANHSAQDIFEQFFGGSFGGFFGGGGMGGRRGPKKGDDIVHELSVTLEDLYKGKTSKLSVTRNVLCSKCSGSGAKPGVEGGKCKGCEGRGIRLIIKQLGPGMIQQMQTVCPECNGRGETINEEDKCKECKGKKVVKEKKILNVDIEKGMKHGQKIVFGGEADEAPGLEAGDIIFVLSEKKHEIFKRNGADLYMEYKLPLVEALGGFAFSVKHLDGRELIVKSEKDIIRPDEVRMIQNEGMPMYKRGPFEKGSLYIKFSIEFPKKELTPKQIQDLEKILGNRRPAPKIVEGVEEVQLTKPSPTDQQKQKGGNRGSEAYEEDDEDPSGGHHGGVQCAQQ